MKINEIIKNYFVRMFVCFSLILIAFCTFATAIGSENDFIILTLPSVWTFLGYSALFSLSFMIASLIKNKVVLRRCVQFVLSFISLSVFIPGSTFISEGQNPAFRILLIAFVFVVVYTLCSLVYLVFTYFANKILNRNKEYENLFDEQRK